MITEQRDEISQATGAKIGTRVTVYPDIGAPTSVVVRNTYAGMNTDWVIQQVIAMMQYVVVNDLVAAGDYSAATLDSYVAALAGPPQTTTAALIKQSGFAGQIPH